VKSLAIDTSNQALTVSVADGRTVLARIVTNEAKNHSIQLLPAIQEVVQQANWAMADIQRIIVAQGPGSFTGLRIGTTVAKTLAYTLNTEIVGVSSLAVLAQQHDVPGLVVPLFNARNDNVFAGVYRWSGEHVANVLPDAHQPLTNLLADLAQYDEPVTFVGDTDVFETQLPADATIVSPEQSLPNGESIVALGYAATPATSVDDFNPNYLRRTQAELNWLAQHPGEERPQDYVARV
jgi:tRNA threonylcarbamoyl adenosine modification protein YeaZ